MRVKMLTKAAGPHWSANPADELDLPLEIAAQLVSGGYAERVEEAAPKPEPKPAPEPETAMVAPAAEKAVAPAAKAKAKPKSK